MLTDEEFAKRYPQWIGFRDGLRGMAWDDYVIFEIINDFRVVLNEAKNGDEFESALCPDKWCYPNDKGLEESVLGRAYWGWMIWQMLASTYGSYGVSIRGSWIEHEYLDDVLNILDNVQYGDNELYEMWRVEMEGEE